MSAIKNYIILLYCHFNKIIKGPGISFQPPAWVMSEMFTIQCNSIWPNCILIILRESTWISINVTFIMCNFHYVAIPMMMTQILKFVVLTKTQISRYLENETSFLEIKKKCNTFATSNTFSGLFCCFLFFGCLCGVVVEWQFFSLCQILIAMSGLK